MKNIPVTFIWESPPGGKQLWKDFSCLWLEPEESFQVSIESVNSDYLIIFFSKFFAGLYTEFMLCLRPNFLFINVEYCCFILGLYLRE